MKIQQFHSFKSIRTKLADSRFLCGAIVSVGLLVLLGSARASVTTLSFQPNPTNLDDLDHHMVYTWRIDNINLSGMMITGASLSIANIANWNTDPNVLHLHLLDTAINPGVASFVDDPGNEDNDLTDDFTNTRFHNSPGWLVKNGTGDTFLADPSFTTKAANYTLNFTPGEIQALAAYIANGGDIALGLDPDCHFYNDGITFTINLAPVPEMSALYPIIGLIVAVGSTRLLRRRRLARLETMDLED